MKSAEHIWTTCSPYKVHLRAWRKCLAHLWTKATKAGMAVIMVAGCAAAVGCHAHTQASGTDQGPVVEVTVTKVQRGFITDDVLVSGNLASMPNRDAKLAPLVSGRIAHVAA